MILHGLSDIYGENPVGQGNVGKIPGIVTGFEEYEKDDLVLYDVILADGNGTIRRLRRTQFSSAPYMQGAVYLLSQKENVGVVNYLRAYALYRPFENIITQEVAKPEHIQESIDDIFDAIRKIPQHDALFSTRSYLRLPKNERDIVTRVLYEAIREEIAYQRIRQAAILSKDILGPIRARQRAAFLERALPSVARIFSSVSAAYRALQDAFDNDACHFSSIHSVYAASSGNTGGGCPSFFKSIVRSAAGFGGLGDLPLLLKIAQRVDLHIERQFNATHPVSQSMSAEDKLDFLIYGFDRQHSRTMAIVKAIQTVVVISIVYFGVQVLTPVLTVALVNIAILIVFAGLFIDGFQIVHTTKASENMHALQEYRKTLFLYPVLRSVLDRANTATEVMDVLDLYNEDRIIPIPRSSSALERVASQKASFIFHGNGHEQIVYNGHVLIEGETVVLDDGDEIVNYTSPRSAIAYRALWIGDRVILAQGRKAQFTPEMRAQFPEQSSIVYQWNIITETIQRQMKSNSALRQALLAFISNDINEGTPLQFLTTASRVDTRVARIVDRYRDGVIAYLSLPEIPEYLLEPYIPVPLYQDILEIRNQIEAEEMGARNGRSLEEVYGAVRARVLQYANDNSAWVTDITHQEKELVVTRYRFARDCKLLALESDLQNKPLRGEEGIWTTNNGVVIGTNSQYAADVLRLLEPNTWQSRTGIKDRVYEIVIDGKHFILKEKKTPRHTDVKQDMFSFISGVTSKEEFTIGEDMTMYGNHNVDNLSISWEQPIGYVTFPDGYQFVVFHKIENLNPLVLYTYPLHYGEVSKRYTNNGAQEKVIAFGKLLAEKIRAYRFQFELEYQEIMTYLPKRYADNTDADMFSAFASAKAWQLIEEGALLLELAPILRGYDVKDVDGYGYRLSESDRLTLEIIGFDYEFFTAQPEILATLAWYQGYFTEYRNMMMREGVPGIERTNMNSSFDQLVQKMFLVLLEHDSLYTYITERAQERKNDIVLLLQTTRTVMEKVENTMLDDIAIDDVRETYIALVLEDADIKRMLEASGVDYAVGTPTTELLQQHAMLTPFISLIERVVDRYVERRERQHTPKTLSEAINDDGCYAYNRFVSVVYALGTEYGRGGGCPVRFRVMIKALPSTGVGAAVNVYHYFRQFSGWVQGLLGRAADVPEARGVIGIMKVWYAQHQYALQAILPFMPFLEQFSVNDVNSDFVHVVSGVWQIGQQFAAYLASYPWDRLQAQVAALLPLAIPEDVMTWAINAAFMVHDIVQLPGQIVSSFLLRIIMFHMVNPPITVAALEARGATVSLTATKYEVRTLRSTQSLPILSVTENGITTQYVPYASLLRPNEFDQSFMLDKRLNILQMNDQMRTVLHPFMQIGAYTLASRTVAFLLVQTIANAVGNAIVVDVHPLIPAGAVLIANLVSEIVEVPLVIGINTARVVKAAIVNRSFIRSVWNWMYGEWERMNNKQKDSTPLNTIVEALNDDACYFTYSSRVFATSPGGTGGGCSSWMKAVIRSFAGFGGLGDLPLLQKIAQHAVRFFQGLYPNREEEGPIIFPYSSENPPPVELLESKLIAVHATDVLPEKGIVQAGARNVSDDEDEFDEPPSFRPTVHFTLGELVRDHSGNSWEHKPYAVITHLRSLLPQLVNIYTYDTFIIGNYKLKKGDTILVPKGTDTAKIPDFVTIVEYNRFTGLRAAVDKEIQARGGWPIRMEDGSSGDIGDAVKVESININASGFYSELMQLLPSIGFGNHLESEIGHGFRFGVIESNIKFLLSLYTNPRYYQVSTQELELRKSLILHNVKQLEHYVSIQSFSPESIGIFHEKRNKLLSWLNVVELDLILRKNHHRTIQLASSNLIAEIIQGLD